MKFLLLPVFVQVALTFGLTLALGRSRVAAIKTGAVKLKDAAFRQDVWPDNVRKISNSYQNQLELPILFYALCAFALATGLADLTLTIGAWIFVILRCAHAYEHLGANNVVRRFQLFAAGVTVLVVLWLYFAARVLLA